MAGLSVGTYRISRMRAISNARIYEPDDYKSRVKQMWSKRAPQYDFKNDFHPPLCEQLVSLADIKGQAARILDVATGTGTVAVSAACALGPSGTVTAVDVSHEMLTQAGPLYRFARGSNMLCTAQMPTEPANETCIHASDLPHSGFMRLAVAMRSDYKCHFWPNPISVHQLSGVHDLSEALSFDLAVVHACCPSIREGMPNGPQHGLLNLPNCLSCVCSWTARLHRTRAVLSEFFFCPGQDQGKGCRPQH